MKTTLFEDIVTILGGLGTILFILSMFVLPWMIIAFLATGIYYLVH